MMQNAFHSIDAVEALKISIQCELDMKDYYKKAATLVGDHENAETIFSKMWQKEEKNKKRLIKTYSDVTGKKILYLKLGPKHKLNVLQRCSNDPVDAIKTVKRNETELKEFYTMVSRRLPQAELRELFRRFAEEREQHLALLESTFDEPLEEIFNPSAKEEKIIA